MNRPQEEHKSRAKYVNDFVNNKRSGFEAYYMDNDKEADQRAPHRQIPNKSCSLETLKELGVIYWHLDADAGLEGEDLKKIRSDRGYSYHDIITVHKDTLPNYEAKIKSFFEEHLHSDEEIRFIIDGKSKQILLSNYYILSFSNI